MVVKAEITQGELNPRFVVTSLENLSDVQAYEFYCARGEQENRIKEMKLDLNSGRTSCHRFLANQFRLLMHTAACMLMGVLQESLAGTRFAEAQIGTRQDKVAKGRGKSCRNRSEDMVSPAKLLSRPRCLEMDVCGAGVRLI